MFRNPSSDVIQIAPGTVDVSPVLAIDPDDAPLTYRLEGEDKDFAHLTEKHQLVLNKPADYDVKEKYTFKLLADKQGVEAAAERDLLVEGISLDAISSFNLFEIISFCG